MKKRASAMLLAGLLLLGGCGQNDPVVTPAAEPVVTPDVGILASLDILALDQACIDLVYNLPDKGGEALIKRAESRHGLRQLTYMKELKMGNDRYRLIDIDHDDQEVTAAQAIADIKPGWVPDEYNTFAGRNPIKIKA